MNRAVDQTPMPIRHRVEIRSIVGNQDDGSSCNRGAFDHRRDERRGGFIESGGGFIEEYQPGFGQDQTCDIHATRHAV